MYTVKSKELLTKIDWVKEDELFVLIGEKSLKADILKLGNGQYHFLVENKSYAIELIAINKSDKTVQLKVNGAVYNLEIRDKLDELLQKLGLENTTKQKVSELKAPMPGLVIEIRVTPGQLVSKGDPILLLEAMKMENIIKSPVEAVIKKIHFNKGEAVEKGAVLVSFE